MEEMNVAEVDLEEVAEVLDPTTTPRDISAWHVSNLLESARLITKGDVRYHEYEGAPLGIMSMGRIWEHAADAYMSQWAKDRGGLYIPNVTCIGDDVVCSLDGLVRLPAVWHVVEIKLRFTASTDIPLKHRQQVMAYCHAACVDSALYVDLHVTSGPPTASAFIRRLSFTKQEIAENWQMIVSTKQFLEAQGCSPQSPRGTYD